MLVRQLSRGWQINDLVLFCFVCSLFFIFCQFMRPFAGEIKVNNIIILIIIIIV